MQLNWKPLRNGKVLGVAGPQDKVLCELWYDTTISRYNWVLLLDRGQTKGVAMSMDEAKRHAWAAVQHWCLGAGLAFK